MLTRVTFFSIGQSPRRDLVPEIVERLPQTVDVVEVGALDGLGRDTIAALQPGPQDGALVTRLDDGSQVVLSKRWVQQRLQALLDASREEEAAGAGRTNLTVLLCTGRFPGLTAQWPFVEAQHLVDHGVAAVCARATTVGLLVPLGRQEQELHYELADGQTLRTAHASPYEDADFEAAGRSLAGCDVVVMHCLGYTEAQRAAVARGADGPVLLARRMVADGVAQLL